MGVALAVTSSLLNAYSQNSALIEQGKVNQQTARNYLTTMNFNFQKLEQQRHDLFEAAVDELEKDRIQGNRLEASVEAAINEGLSGGGRTADLLKRASQAETNRATAQVKANYQKQSNEIDLNKENALQQAKMGIASIQDVKKPSMFGTLLGVASSFYTARTNELQINAMRKSAGINSGPALSIATPSAASNANATTDWTGILDGGSILGLDQSQQSYFD